MSVSSLILPPLFFFLFVCYERQRQLHLRSLGFDVGFVAYSFLFMCYTFVCISGYLDYGLGGWMGLDLAWNSAQLG